MELKEADKSDIEDIIYLFKDKYGAVAEGLIHELENAVGKDRMVLAFLDEKPVGFLRSSLSENPDGSLDDEVLTMVIAGDYYGRGIGGALLEEERKFAAASGASILRIVDIENP